MTTSGTRRPSDDEISSAMTRLRDADPIRDVGQHRIDVVDEDSMLASVRGDRGRHRPGRLRRAVPVLVAAAVVLIVAAGVAVLPRVIGSPTSGSKPTPIGLTASPNPSYRIPKGDRLPAITRVDVIETLKGGKPTRKGQLPEDVARSIVAHLNNDATSAEGGAVEMDCPMRVLSPAGDPPYEAVYEPQFDLTLYNGGTDVASVGLGGECTKLVMTVDDGDYNYVITGGQEQVVVDELKRATSPPSASPSPSAASSSADLSYRIPKGDRLPAITGVNVTETRPDGIRTVLGSLPESVARDVVQQLNSDHAAGDGENVEMMCSGNADSNGNPIRYPDFTLTLYGDQQGKAAATATIDGRCESFDLTVGPHSWTANPARPGDLARAIVQAFPRPAADLPQPTSIVVTALSTAVGSMPTTKTLTGKEARRVWTELTVLPKRELIACGCPVGIETTYTLAMKRGSVTYATAFVSRAAALDVTLDQPGRPSLGLDNADAVVGTLKAAFARHS